jgi:hypothetical protein
VHFLDNQRKKVALKGKDLKDIENYRNICRKIIREAMRRENDRYVSCANNKTKSVWKIVNKEIGNSTVNNKKIEINNL